MRRASAWKEIPDPTVLRLTVEAVDEQEQRTTDLEHDFKIEMEKMNARLGKILWVMVGILSSIVVGIVLFALTGAHP